MSIQTTLKDAGNKISETATKVGHVVGEKAEQATDWAKEKMHQAGNRIDEAKQKAEHAAGGSCGTAKSVSDIAPHMDVIASCGKRIGAVDHLDGASSIKLTKNDPTSGGQHHWIPTSWVKRVDEHVHLNVNSDEAMQGWKTSAV